MCIYSRIGIEPLASNYTRCLIHNLRNYSNQQNVLNSKIAEKSTCENTVETRLLAHALMGSIAELYALIMQPHPVTGCLCDEGLAS